MTRSRSPDGTPQGGFTLVELAIVMIIIGLLIGGILKGQELIANAQVTATISQLKGIEAATTTFRDMYDAVPGDIVNAITRLPGCVAATPCATLIGNGNSRIDVAVNAAAGADEGRGYWVHLSSADLLGGIDPTAAIPASWGGAYPAAEISGGYMIGFTNGGALATLPGAVGSTVRGGHYLSIRGAPGIVAEAGGNETLSATQAARIDRKMDDGLPGDGTVRSTGAAGCTQTVGSIIYNEAADAQLCNLYIRIQQ